MIKLHTFFIACLLCSILFLAFHNSSIYQVLIYVIVAFSLLLFLQGIFSIFLLIYAWEDPTNVEKNKSPKKFIEPHYSFSALVPARHEDRVLHDTLKAISDIHYPDELKQILVIVRFDDTKTIDAATKMIDSFSSKNIQLVLFDGYPINKPHGLNIARSEARGDVVVVFDAEDEPHPEIYNIVNTIMHTDHADVVQSGVQLMNYNSSWFSILNVLEYFFWYKSSLLFFARCGMIPLGGNTVFFKRSWLDIVHGWDEQCLTEDADIGIKLSVAGAKIGVVYDEKHSTQEETPPTLVSFIKQRTRWTQGWLQILLKGEWLALSSLPKKLLALYILLSPIMQSLMFLYIPFSMISIIVLKLPVGLALFSVLPLYVFILQQIIYNVGLFEFTHDYGFSYPLWAPIMIFCSFFPFQLVLNFCSFRAAFRLLAGHNTWEKTTHVNAHRGMAKAVS